MQYDIKKQKGSVKIDFTLDKKEWDDAVEQAYQRTRNKYSMPGFRKGKVPKNVLVKVYGESVFLDDAFNEVFPAHYNTVLDENPDLFPVDRPSVGLDDIDDNGVKFSAVVTVRPEVKLGVYKGLKLAKAEYPLGAKDVEQEIERARERLSKKAEVKDRAAKMGDIANIDYSGSVDGVKFDGGTAEKFDLELGAKSFIEGFEEGVVGMNIGEDKNIEVTFPAKYHSKELAGKKAVFAVKLNGLQQKELPPLDDEFAKTVSACETFAEYKKDVEKRLTEQSTKRADTENENNLLKAITDNVEAEIPDCMTESHLDNLMREFEYTLMYQGMKKEDYFKYTNTSEEDMRKARRNEAANGVKTRLAVEEIIKAEKLEASEKEIEAEIAKLAEQAKKSVEEFSKTVDTRRREYMQNEIVMDKLIKLLKDATEWVKIDPKSQAKTAKTEKAEKSDK